MVSDRSTEIGTTIDRILRERLEQHEVPVETRNEIRDAVLAFLGRPQTDPFGATVMTPEASMAGDHARKTGKPQPPGPNTPKIV